MFDALYPDEAEAVLQLKAERPPDPQKLGAFTGFWSAIGKAPVRGGLESARALKKVTPLQAGSPLMMSASEQEEMLSDNAVTKENIDSSLAQAIKDTTPDPNSTGAASMVLHDVGRFVSKAVGYGLAAGTPGAIAGMGLDEGYNEAARRLDAGVDPTTAAKLGVTKGVASAVAVAFPVAGKTLAGTAGLAVAGGPASYIAESVVSREILRNADYEKLAAEIDPLDPFALTVSMLGPLGFGLAAHAMRAARARGTPPAGTPHIEPGPLKPNEPVGPTAPKTGSAQDAVPVSSVDAVDAAHVSLLKEQKESATLSQRDDLSQAGAHDQAMDTAAEQLARGQKVDVADIAPKPEGIEVHQQSLDGRDQTSIDLAAIESHPLIQFVGRLAQGAVDFGKLSVKDIRVDQLLPLDGGAKTAHLPFDAQPLEAGGSAQPVKLVSDPVGIGAASAPKILAPGASDPSAPGAAFALKDPSLPMGNPRLFTESLRILAETPELPVMLEGREGPAPASQLIAEIEAQVKQEAKEASLLQVAAECFLRG